MHIITILNIIDSNANCTKQQMNENLSRRNFSVLFFIEKFTIADDQEKLEKMLQSDMLI